MNFKMRNPPTMAERAALARSRREFLEDWMETAIAILDRIDGEPDAEPDECVELFLQVELRGGANVRAA